MLPDAFVRELGANPGYGAAANEVLRLVEGESGFFCFCHDDVALDHDAVRVLVEELYRSNAGVVGPKLVTWDDTAVLQHVGLGLDRFGEVDPITEPGEYDQEQHDAVRDVFALPSACLLVRADLFRALGGFDPSITFHGDDIDLCWRIHLRGARVVVVPQARARHREELEARRPDLHHDLLRARHRMRTVVTLTGGGRLPLRSLEMVLLTVGELVIGAFTGRLAEAWASVRSLLGLIPRTPRCWPAAGRSPRPARSATTRSSACRHGGSARLASFRRSRDTETYIGAETNVRRWRESSLAVTATWILLLVGIVLASRTLIDDRVPTVGEFLPLPASARDLLGDFSTAWNPGGLGQTVANPTGWAVCQRGQRAVAVPDGRRAHVHRRRARHRRDLGHVAPGHRVPDQPRPHHGDARLRRRAAPARAWCRRADLSGLVAYAALPWFVHLLRVAVGIGTADPAAAADDLVEGIIPLTVRERVRRTALLLIVTAIAVAMAPALLPVLLVVVVVLGVTTLLVGAGWRTHG